MNRQDVEQAVRALPWLCEPLSCEVVEVAIDIANSMNKAACRAICYECRRDHHVDEACCMAIEIRKLKIT